MLLVLINEKTQNLLKTESAELLCELTVWVQREELNQVLLKLVLDP